MANLSCSFQPTVPKSLWQDFPLFRLRCGDMINLLAQKALK
jgi:hypothetical protein